MKRLYQLQHSPLSILALAGLSALLLWLIPAEQTLGNIIKVIFLHGALVEVGLLVFAAAGLVGLAYLVWRTETLDRWTMRSKDGRHPLDRLCAVSMVSTETGARVNGSPGMSRGCAPAHSSWDFAFSVCSL
ncbi:MAG: hypothetical protein KF893_04270 [Caldilineaceae bacterium]|nr:hypothetical protein [Caldilineaceae bacterium]